MNQGQWSEAEPLTVAAFLERYLADVAAHTLRPKTLETYSLIVRTHLNPALGHLRLTALRPMQVQDLYAARLAAGKSRRTVQYIYAVLHRALNQAVK